MSGVGHVLLHGEVTSDIDLDSMSEGKIKKYLKMKYKDSFTFGST